MKGRLMLQGMGYALMGCWMLLQDPSGTGKHKLVPEDRDSAYQFLATSAFLDASISSINSFHSLIQKENYRTRITSLNNPASSDLGFSLQNEVQLALKPLLAKAKHTNTEKFSQVVNSLLAPPANGLKTALTSFTPAFPTLLGLVSNMTIAEKRISREDLDSFITTVSRYFVQYERLHQANKLFDEDISRLNAKIRELQFDVREYMLDLVMVLYPNVQRNALKNLQAEEILLTYLDPSRIEQQLKKLSLFPVFPSDGIKSAKEIASSLQKIFAEYQKIYMENYQLIRGILMDVRSMGKNIDTRQLNASLQDLEKLYNESKTSDSLSLRLSTLSERLKWLVATEQPGREE